MQSKTLGSIQWKPEGLVCLRCGTPNPDRGNICGNCGENPFFLPGLRTQEQKEILAAVNRLHQQ